VLRALTNAADALNPGGVYAIDIEDLEWGDAWANIKAGVRRSDDWVIATEYSRPEPHKYIRDMTTFLRNADGTWRRDDERHENTLIDTAQVPALLNEHGVQVECRSAFGEETFPPGLVALVGQKMP
jgi:hypothetical protein